MKRELAYTISICLLVFPQTYAQKFSLKYGKVTASEVEMTSYPKDSTASAVVLMKQGYIYFDYRNNKFKIETEYENKIKIIKTEGTKYANVVIPFYANTSGGRSKDIVSRIEAYAYNMENGKIVKTKMSKDYIFEEQISNTWKQIKFAIPSVKAGTVIEYRYKIISDFYSKIPNWEIQQSIPVIYAHFEARIPEYFKFAIDTRGYEPIKAEDTNVGQTFNINFNRGQQKTMQCICRKLSFTSNDVPALKNDNNVWCPRDFMSRVNFELSGIQLPFSTYKSYSSTWEDIGNTLKKSNYFGNYLSLRNPYKDEMKSLSFEGMSRFEQITTLFHFLKKKMSWNEKYGISGEDVKKAIKNGVGSNAEFNFIFLSMLQDAGIPAYPVLMSNRPMGRLPYSHPSLNRINTFIVGIEDTDSTMVYADGSIEYGDINILPPRLMVDRARVLNNGQGYWVDLTKVGRNTINSMTTATLDGEGKLTGKRQTSYAGVYAADYKSMFYHAKDSADFIEKRQTEDNITIEECQQSKMDKLSPRVSETINFTKSVMATEDHIYLNPMVFPHITKNRFTQEERKLPVEFPFPYDLRLNTIITIPDNYEIEEMPETTRFSSSDRGIVCTYSVKQSNNQLVMNYIIKFNKIIYPTANYPELKKFWKLLVQKNTEQVVLKKKSL